MLTVVTTLLSIKATLKHIDKQSIVVYYGNIPNVSVVPRTIKKNLHKFKKPPIGPVGAYVKLKGNI